LRIAERGFDREMILERDFSLQVFSRKHREVLDATRTGYARTWTMRGLGSAGQYRSRLPGFAIAAAGI